MGEGEGESGRGDGGEGGEEENEEKEIIIRGRFEAPNISQAGSGLWTFQLRPSH